MAEVSMMAIAVRAGTGAWGAHQWPMTRDAWEALDGDARRLTAQVSTKEAYVTGRLDGDADAPTFLPNIAGQQLLRQLNNVRDVLERAVVVEDGEVAVIGRRVTLQEPDGATSTYALVIPGAGDPHTGLVSVDSPVGRALLGRRLGEAVTIEAPSGPWTATVAGLE
jgi:transcription elongation GreA/GreB family factor